MSSSSGPGTVFLHDENVHLPSTFEIGKVLGSRVTVRDFADHVFALRL